MYLPINATRWHCQNFVITVGRRTLWNNWRKARSYVDSHRTRICLVFVGVLKGKCTYFIDCWHKISMCKHLFDWMFWPYAIYWYESCAIFYTWGPRSIRGCVWHAEAEGRWPDREGGESVLAGWDGNHNKCAELHLGTGKLYDVTWPHRRGNTMWKQVVAYHYSGNSNNLWSN